MKSSWRRKGGGNDCAAMAHVSVHTVPGYWMGSLKEHQLHTLTQTCTTHIAHTDTHNNTHTRIHIFTQTACPSNINAVPPPPSHTHTHIQYPEISIVVTPYRHMHLVEVVVRLLCLLLSWCFELLADDEHPLKQEHMPLLGPGEERASRVTMPLPHLECILHATELQVTNQLIRC